jgi:hypothetical protein
MRSSRVAHVLGRAFEVFCASEGVASGNGNTCPPDTFFRVSTVIHCLKYVVQATNNRSGERYKHCATARQRSRRSPDSACHRPGTLLISRFPFPHTRAGSSNPWFFSVLTRSGTDTLHAMERGLQGWSPNTPRGLNEASTVSKAALMVFAACLNSVYDGLLPRPARV